MNCVERDKKISTIKEMPPNKQQSKCKNVLKVRLPSLNEMIRVHTKQATIFSSIFHEVLDLEA